MSRYRTRLSKDLDFFVEKGLIETSQRDAMLAALPEEKSRASLSGILVVLAAVLVAAALLSFIAANWEAIPRLVRLGSLIGLTWVLWIGIAYARIHSKYYIAAALGTLAFAAFGGGIALVGQMYHLSGDAPDALLLWFGGSILGALLMRSPAMTLGCIGLAGFYPILIFESGGLGWHEINYFWLSLVLFAVCGFAIYLSKALWLTRFLFVSIAIYLFIQFEQFDWSFMYLAIVAWVLYFLCHLASMKFGKSQVLWYACSSLAWLGFAATFWFQFLLWDQQESSIFFTAPIVLALVVLVLLTRGAMGKEMRRLCYLVFAIEVFLLYVITVGSLIGTAGFFLLLGIGVLVLAGGLWKFEKWMMLRKSVGENNSAEMSP